MSSAFTDAWGALNGPSGGETGSFDQNREEKPPTRRLDYIFLGKDSGFVVEAVEVDGEAKSLSDHLPVIAKR